jgi:hypothetical protein
MNDYTKTVSITDYDMLSPTLARVVIAYTGRQTKESIRATILEKTDNLAAPVENSFRIVKANSVGGIAVGYLRANKEVRVIDEKEIRAGYRVMSSNIMMDNSDRSLWEVKEGKGGKYLARHGNEDLTALLASSNGPVIRRPDVPGVRHLATASAARNEFVAFVSASGDMDYGFVIASSKDKLKVVSYTTQAETIIGYSSVASINQVPVPKSHNQEMLKAGISPADKAQASEYWRKLYSYNPAYMQDVIDQVNEDATA